MIRSLSLFIALFSLIHTITAFETADVRPLLEKTCFKCHSDKKAKAGISFQHFKDEMTLWRDRGNWERVLDSLIQDAMPPEDSGKELSGNERKQLVHWIEHTLGNVDISRLPKDPGHVPPRRLNSAEYSYTIQDLFGITFNPAPLLPNDQSSQNTFDNEAVVLGVQTLHMEKYIAASRGVMDAVWTDKDALAKLIFTAPAGESPSTVGLAVIVDKQQSKTLDMGDGSFTVYVRFKADDTQGALFSKAPANEEWKPHAKVLFLNDDGRISYDIGWVGQFSGGPRLNDNTWHHAVLRQSGETAHIYVDGKHVASEELSRPDKGSFHFKIGCAGDEFTPLDGEISQLLFYNTGLDERAAAALSKGTLPKKRADFSWSPRPKRHSADGLTERKAAESVMKRFLTQTFRRKTSQSEFNRYMKLYQSARDDGDDYFQAFRHPMETALISPSFLFRTETVRSETQHYRINGVELANRLSYFLWVSQPDMDLLTLGASGELLNEDVLKSQVKRMLKDPKSARMSERFMSQWLRTDGLGTSHVPDKEVFDTIDDDLMAAMKQESVLLAHEIFTQNRHLMEFITADYSFVNDRLAKHYDIKKPGSSTMTRVTLDNGRRGLLTHAGVLTASSSPRRTSPVFRGKWILEVILGYKVPPPPPNAGELEASTANDPVSLREQLDAHRQKAACYSCHQKIDPLGFALESFDAVGRLREGKVDNTGRLPDGTEVSGHNGLITLIETKNQDPFIRTISIKMLSFALGRELGLPDEVTLQRLSNKLASENYSAQTLIEGIVWSYPFLYRKEPPTKGSVR